MENILGFTLIGATLISLAISVIVTLSIFKISAKNKVLIYKNPFMPRLRIRTLSLLYTLVMLGMGIAFNVYFFFFL